MLHGAASRAEKCCGRPALGPGLLEEHVCLAPMKFLSSLARLSRRCCDLRTSLRYSDVGPHGPLIKDLFSRLRDIRGSFNVADCSHFHLVLSMQSAFGIQGDLLEIGSFHGSSTAMMARYLANGEALPVCDAFELIAPQHPHESRPTPTDVLANIRSVKPLLARHRVTIYACLSTDLP